MPEKSYETIHATTKFKPSDLFRCDLTPELISEVQENMKKSQKNKKIHFIEGEHLSMSNNFMLTEGKIFQQRKKKQNKLSKSKKSNI